MGYLMDWDDGSSSPIFRKDGDKKKKTLDKKHKKRVFKMKKNSKRNNWKKGKLSIDGYTR